MGNTNSLKVIFVKKLREAQNYGNTCKLRVQDVLPPRFLYKYTYQIVTCFM